MILAIDTSQMIYSLATDDIYREWQDVNVTLYDQLEDIDLSQLSVILISTGPGRFSGLRSGLSFTKGLARGLGVPVIAVDRFELIQSILNQNATIALDARKEQVYLKKPGQAIQLMEQNKLSELMPLYGDIEPGEIIPTNAKDLIDYYHKHQPTPVELDQLEPLYIRDSV